MFRNDHNRMITVGNSKKYPPFFIYYYEMPLKSNFKLEMKQETPKTPVKKTIKKDTEKEAEFFKERIQYFQDKLKELGYGESINEVVKFLNSKYQKIIND